MTILASSATKPFSCSWVFTSRHRRPYSLHFQPKSFPQISTADSNATPLNYRQACNAYGNIECDSQQPARSGNPNLSAQPPRSLRLCVILLFLLFSSLLFFLSSLVQTAQTRRITIPL